MNLHKKKYTFSTCLLVYHLDYDSELYTLAMASLQNPSGNEIRCLQ